METIKIFREKMTQGQICMGASITFTDPLVTDALGDSVDFVWIDMEHSGLSPETVGRHLLAARARKVPGLVRVRSSATPDIKPILDLGAEGIIVPQVRTADEVGQVVSDCRYTPLGHRGYGPRVPSNYGRDGGPEYPARANENLFVAVQIETTEALAALDDILSVPGLDSLVIGPWDLSGALGLLGQVEHPDVVAAIDMIVAKARATGLVIGAGMGTDAEFAYRMAKRGIQWLQVGGDSSYLIKAFDEIVGSIQSLLGQVQA